MNITGEVLVNINSDSVSNNVASGKIGYGTAVGITTDTVNPKFGTGSLKFTNGSNSHIEVSTADNTKFQLGPDDDFTISVWIKADSGMQFASLFGRSTSYSAKLSVTYSGALTPYLQPGQDNSMPSYCLVSSVAYTVGEWVHIAATRHNRTYYLFINGKIGMTTTDNYNFYMSGTNIPPFIGWDGFQGNAYFYGDLDDMVVIRDQALWTADFSDNIPTTYLLDSIPRSKTSIYLLKQY